MTRSPFLECDWLAVRFQNVTRSPFLECDWFAVRFQNVTRSPFLECDWLAVQFQNVTRSPFLECDSLAVQFLSSSQYIVHQLLRIVYSSILKTEAGISFEMLPRLYVTAPSHILSSVYNLLTTEFQLISVCLLPHQYQFRQQISRTRCKKDTQGLFSFSL